MDPIRYLAREVEQLKKADRDKGSTPQLGTSSIENGTLGVNENGVLKQTIGMQPDGTNVTVAFNGPTPPTPSTPTVESLSEAVKISWDGLWVGGAFAPLDLSRIDVHIVSDTATNPLTTPPVATIAAAGWGEASVPVAAGNYYAVLVAWTMSGQYAISNYSAIATSLPTTVPSSDGLAPEASPVATLRQFAVSALAWKLVPLANPDPQTYRVYAGLTGFVPGVANLVYEGPNTEGRFDRIGAALLMPTDTALPSPQYVVRVIARDADDSAAIGAESNAVSARRADNYDISALYAYFGDVEVGQLTSGTVNASMILAGEIFAQVALARAGISGTDGFVSFGPDGSQIMSVPIVPDENGKIAAFLRAALTATSLTVEDFLALRGVNNEFSKGSVTTLATGTTRPSSPPQPSIDYQLKSRFFGSLAWGQTGFAKDGSTYWVASSFFGGSLAQFAETADSFDLLANYDLGSNINPVGVTVLGANVYVLASDGSRTTGDFGNYYVRRYDKTTGAFVDEWRYQPAGTSTGVYSNYRPTIGNDGTDIIIAQCANQNTAPGNYPVIRRYVPATGSLIGTAATSIVVADHLTSINVGTFDLGLTAYYLTREGSSTASAIVNSASDGSLNFPLPKTSGKQFLIWDGTIFKTLTDDGVYLHTQHFWTSTALDRWWVAHSWFDNNLTNGLHETSISNKVSFPMKKRARLTITAPPLPAATGGPDDVTGVRIYHGQGVSTPTDVNMKRALAEIPDGVTTVQYTTTMDRSTSANTGTPAPFPMSVPARIQSSVGGMVMSGDGNLVVPTARAKYSSGDGGATDTSSGSSTYKPIPSSGLVFVAPASGVVVIHMSAISRTSTNSIAAVMTFEVRTGATIGAGTIVRSPIEFISNAGTEYLRMGATDIAEGLTPGETYNVQGVFRSSTAGTVVTCARATFVLQPSL